LFTEDNLETLPNLGETIVLHIINANQPITAYQIRKQFNQTTNKRLSFGTLVPMLQQFEKSQFVVRLPKRLDEPISYNWFLTNGGIEELEFRLASHVKILNACRPKQDSGLNFQHKDSENMRDWDPLVVFRTIRESDHFRTVPSFPDG